MKLQYLGLSRLDQTTDARRALELLPREAQPQVVWWSFAGKLKQI